MAWTKAKTAIVAGAIVLLAAGTTTVTVKEVEKYQFDNSWRTQDIFAFLKKVNEVSPQVKILPSNFRPKPNLPSGVWMGQHGKTAGVAVPAESIVEAAYGCKYSDRVVIATELPKGYYDFIANLSGENQNRETLQQLVKQKFGVVAKWETLETNALLLTVQIPNAPGLSPTAKKNPPAELYGQTSYGVFDKSLTNLANFLDASLGIPVVDHTGLTNNFDFTLKWNESQQRQARGLQGLSGPMVKALTEQLGLALIPANNTPVEMLIVEKAK